MTTVQTMLNPPKRRRIAASTLCVLLAAASGVVGGCTKTTSRGRLDPPEMLVAPHDQTKGEALWAVVPIGNESGVSFVDTMAFSDTLVNVITEVRGVACVPMNRTIAALRMMGDRAINTPQAARALANFMGVDGVVIGSITAYDPYDPPKLGLTLALFSQEGRQEQEIIDPIKLQAAYTDQNQKSGSTYMEKPASVVSEYYDAANHQVLMDARRYGAGRTNAESAMGWKTSLLSMDMYTKFAAYQTVSRLLEQERLRLARGNAPAAGGEIELTPPQSPTR